MPLFFLSHKYARQGKHSTRFFPKKSRAEREPTPEEKPFPHKYRNKQAKHQAHPNTDDTDGNKPQSSQKISRKHIKKGRKKRGKNNTRENLLKVKQDPTWDKAEFSATTRETASDKLALLCQDATSQKNVFLIVTGGQSGLNLLVLYRLPVCHRTARETSCHKETLHGHTTSIALLRKISVHAGRRKTHDPQ